MNMFWLVFKKVPSGSNMGNGFKNEDRLEKAEINALEKAEGDKVRNDRSDLNQETAVGMKRRQ